MIFISLLFYIKYTWCSISWHPPTTIHIFAQNRPTIIIFLVYIVFPLLRPHHPCIINKIAAHDPHIVTTGIAPMKCPRNYRWPWTRTSGKFTTLAHKCFDIRVPMWKLLTVQTITVVTFAYNLHEDSSTLNQIHSKWQRINNQTIRSWTANMQTVKN